VRFSIFLCFFFRMRLRRFLISEPMTSGNLAEPATEMRNEAPRFRAGNGRRGRG
jgi:hypothetical protein